MKTEFAAPNYFCNVVVIITKMGRRYKKELLQMKKTQVDLETRVFKLDRQAKLGMMREVLAKLDRKASEQPSDLFTEKAS